VSIEALGHVFPLRLPAAEKLLLICLANYADKVGDSIFPSLDTLEIETGLSRSTIKRAFKELVKKGLLLRVAEATPVSPAWYRIADVPEPRAYEPRPTCPAVLRRAVILTFRQTCEYCKRLSESRELDPDGKPWNVDRVFPGRRGGAYAPDNVTLSCRACNAKKKDSNAPEGTRTLSEFQREGRVQGEPSIDDVEGVHLEPWEGEPVNPRRGHCEPREGVQVNPDPSTEPVVDPSRNGRAGACAPAPSIASITKLAHEVFEVLGLRADIGDLTETLKSRCAKFRIPYTSDAVRKALDSARWQRQHQSPETH